MPSNRELVILEILEKEGQPIRGARLHRLGNEYLEYQKMNEEFWYADFPWFMSRLQEKGFVQKIECEKNKVFYALTEEGYDTYLKNTDDKVFRRRLRARLRRAYRRNIRFVESCGIEKVKILTETEDKLPYKDVKSVYLHEYAFWLYQHLYNLDRYGESWNEDSVKAAKEQLLRVVKPDEHEEVLEKAERRAHSSLKHRHEKEIREFGRAVRGRVKVEPLGNCHFCGAGIHNKAAEEDAKLLKKFTGVETGLVCCNCFRHLEWIDKHLNF